MTKKIRTAVFPVAGLGTRFLPATKSIPKEMLPLVHRPLIHYPSPDAPHPRIPPLTGRTIARPPQGASDHAYPVRRDGRVLCNPKHSIPVDLEGDNRLFVIPIEDIVAVFRNES